MGVQQFKFEAVAEIEGLKVISPFIASDDRGLFRKTYEHNIFEENGINIEVSEVEESVSMKGVLRGLHMQHTAPQHKLIHVTHGKIFDVAVDARKGSPSFGKYFSIVLSAENHQMLYIPAGFFHGFLTLEDNTVFSCVCCGDYSKEFDAGIRWDDETVNIQWPLHEIGQPILSDKDRNAISFQEYCERYTW